MPASDFSKKLGEDKPKVEEAPKVEEVQVSPVVKLYSQLEEVQAGRDISAIPLNDPYWEVVKLVQAAEFELTKNR